MNRVTHIEVDDLEKKISIDVDPGMGFEIGTVLEVYIFDQLLVQQVSDNAVDFVLVEVHHQSLVVDMVVHDMDSSVPLVEMAEC